MILHRFVAKPFGDGYRWVCPNCGYNQEQVMKMREDGSQAPVKLGFLPNNIVSSYLPHCLNCEITDQWQEEAWRHHGAIGDELRAAVDEYRASLPAAELLRFSILAQAQSDLLIRGEAAIRLEPQAHEILEKEMP